MGSTISQLYMICIDMYNIYFIIYTHRILTIVYDFPTSLSASRSIDY